MTPSAQVADSAPWTALPVGSGKENGSEKVNGSGKVNVSGSGKVNGSGKVCIHVHTFVHAHTAGRMHLTVCACSVHVYACLQCVNSCARHTQRLNCLLWYETMNTRTKFVWS